MNKTGLIDIPLEGIQFIEASAGTGKTWQICGLYLRLLLESQLKVENILVVTFTKAATAELRERIRHRIIEKMKLLRNDVETECTNEHLPSPSHSIASAESRESTNKQIQLLEQALSSFDEAAIFTIHGFCQRAMSDTAFTARLPFTTELLQDDSEIVLESVSDFWRRNIAIDNLDSGLAALLLHKKDTPEFFSSLVRTHLKKPTANVNWPKELNSEIHSTQHLIDAANQTFNAARDCWRSDKEKIRDCIEAGTQNALDKRTYKTELIESSYREWETLFIKNDFFLFSTIENKKLELLTTTKIEKSTKVNQLERKPVHDFFEKADTLLKLDAEIKKQSTLHRLGIIKKLVQDVTHTIREKKSQQRAITYDDMLTNFHEQLKNDTNHSLSSRLNHRFKAALIDEFQDTDPIQYEVFKSIYLNGKNGKHIGPLFLVGDPKQAIYRFRNADLHTYLTARKDAHNYHSLKENQRSTQSLIDAVNLIFGANPSAFILKDLNYTQVSLGQNKRTELIDDEDTHSSTLRIWHLPMYPHLLNRSTAKELTAKATANELARLLTSSKNGSLRLGDSPLQASDIVVLVQTHKEAAQIRLALTELGIGSVEQSQSSVYKSVMAEDLAKIMSAAIEPNNERLIRSALSTECMGLSAIEITNLDHDEQTFLNFFNHFSAYRTRWMKFGIALMLREWMNKEKVTERLLSRANGERRLTDLMHLIELLHKAEESNNSPDSLLFWFKSQRQNDNIIDEAEIRLESDQSLIKVITIHSSKGLQYPIVFCPFLWDGHEKSRSSNHGTNDTWEYHDENAKITINYDLGNNESRVFQIQQQINLETAAEKIRLIYVALTRAVNRCYLVGGLYMNRQSAAESTKSPLNWLIAGASYSADAWFDPPKLNSTSGKEAHQQRINTIECAWQAIANTSHSKCISFEPLPSETCTYIKTQSTHPDQLTALTPPSHLPNEWRMGSYSSLIRQIEREQISNDDEPHHRHPFLESDQDTTQTDILKFPAGAREGICLHSIFEQIDFNDSSNWYAVIHTALRSLLLTDSDNRFQDMIRLMLNDVLNTPLPISTQSPLLLSQLSRNKRLNELDFMLPSNSLVASKLNQALKDYGFSIPKLQFNDLRGFLKGSIDMVFEHEGRYFILDWKSNHLGNTKNNYTHPAIINHMIQEGYQLQYLLYSVALHRYLSRKIKHYDPEQHFGGAIYLFIRGVRPHWMNPNNIPMGFYFDRPPAALIQRLSNLFLTSNRHEEYA